MFAQTQIIIKLKMKKISKANLVELAMSMPVISENEQDQLMGGTHYYAVTTAGESVYVGELGDGCGLEKVSTNNYTKYCNGDIAFEEMIVGSFKPTNIMSMSGAGLGMSGIMNIFNSIALRKTGSGVNFSDYGTDNMWNNTYDLGYADGNSVSMNTRFVQKCITNNNLDDMLSVLTHELTHVSIRNSVDTYANFLTDQERRILKERIALKSEVPFLGSVSTEFSTGFSSLERENDSSINNIKEAYATDYPGVIDALLGQFNCTSIR